MDHKNAIRNVTTAAVIFGAIGLTAMTATAQAKTPAKKPVVTEKTRRTSGRDPFQKYVPVVKMGKALPTKLDAPSIQVRIDRYRSQKLAAASAHVIAAAFFNRVNSQTHTRQPFPHLLRGQRGAGQMP